MEAPKAPQLTAYDFLGYIVPGLAFIFLVDVSVKFHIHKAPLTYDALCNRYGSLSWPSLVPLLLVAYFLGHIISFASSLTVERHATWMHGPPAKVVIYDYKAKYLDTRTSGSPFTSGILRLLVFLFLIPISFIEIVCGRWLNLSGNYIKPADKLIREAFLRAMSRLLTAIGITREVVYGDDPWEYDLDRLAIHCALERAPMHVHTLRNYVVLFGFLRSMSLLLVAMFWGGLVHFLMLGNFFGAAVFFLVGSFLVFTCYAAFLKFWFRYYQEAIMAIIATASAKAEQADPA